MEPLAAPVLELIQASVWRSRSLPTRSHPGEGGVRAAARPGESDLLLRSGVARGPIAEPKISRKIVAGQPQLSRFGEKLAELPPTGDQVALFRPRLGRLERTCINEREGRQIVLIGLFWAKYARRIFAIVSTTSIPNLAPGRMGPQRMLRGREHE